MAETDQGKTDRIAGAKAAASETADAVDRYGRNRSRQLVAGSRQRAAGSLPAEVGETSGVSLKLAKAGGSALPGGSQRLEVVAPVAVPHVEVVPHDGEQHRVAAVQEVPVLDRLHTELVGELGSAATVPARAVANLGLEAWRELHSRMIPSDRRRGATAVTWQLTTSRGTDCRWPMANWPVVPLPK